MQEGGRHPSPPSTALLTACVCILLILQKKCFKIEETLPKHIQNFLTDEENKNKELEEEKQKQPKPPSPELSKSEITIESDMPTTEVL